MSGWSLEKSVKKMIHMTLWILLFDVMVQHEKSQGIWIFHEASFSLNETMEEADTEYTLSDVNQYKKNIID